LTDAFCTAYLKGVLNDPLSLTSETSFLQNQLLEKPIEEENVDIKCIKNEV
jgi:hypothetical protein